MPHYKKAFDIGTYTGNGGQYRVGIPTLRGVGPSNGQVANSLRFRASNSNYITRTPAASGNRKTWTFSCWFKKTANGGNVGLFSVYGSSSDTNAGGVVFGSSDQIYFMAWSTIWRRTTVAFKDPSRWYHLVIAFDTTQATAANRVKMYIDGRQVDSFAASSDPALNTDYGFNTNNHHEFGAWIPTATSGYSYLDMYLAETYFLDGYAYDASYFGERNSDGIWVPKAYTGSYGTNGFYLKFAPGAAGTDSSGNGNTWTLSGHNVTTSNTTYDIMTDSPTDYLSGSMSTANNAGNYFTINPLNVISTAGSATVANGNMTFISTGSLNNYSYTYVYTNISSGKFYFEGRFTGALSSGLGNGFGITGFYFSALSTGTTIYASSNQTGLATISSGDVFSLAIDLNTATAQLYRNGSTFGSSGSITTTNLVGYLIASNGSGTTAWDVNFGQRPFTYTPPAGYNALNTYNITRPADSSLWFYGDTPDLMWIKNRSTTGLHTITDTVRGAGLNLVTSSTAAETSYPAVSEMNKFGMSVINDATSIVNGSGNSMVYWGWKAGSNTSSTSVTNTDGTITSQVSANRQAGFSIVSYTGTGSNATIGHGLGAAPNLMLVKNRNGANAWDIYSSVLGAGKYLDFTTAASVTNAVLFPTTPTSTVFYVGAAGGQNTNGASHIAYCWTAIPGYSAFGSYTGNGAVDGPFVYLGFRPRWIMIKATSTTSNWIIYDSTRDTYNPTINATYTNTTQADYTAGSLDVDLLSNGFKWRENGGQGNDSGVTFIYAAFAEIPFKFARAR